MNLSGENLFSGQLIIAHLERHHTKTQIPCEARGALFLYKLNKVSKFIVPVKFLFLDAPNLFISALIF